MALGALLDQVFGGLPARAAPYDVPEARPAIDAERVVVIRQEHQRHAPFARQPDSVFNAPARRLPRVVTQRRVGNDHHGVSIDRDAACIGKARLRTTSAAFVRHAQREHYQPQ